MGTCWIGKWGQGISVGFALLFFLIAQVKTADAKCRISDIGIAPQSGTVLAPGEPSYVFLSTKPDKLVISVLVGGASVPANVEAVGSTGKTFSVRPVAQHKRYRVRVEEYNDRSSVCRLLQLGDCKAPGTLTKGRERVVHYRVSKAKKAALSREVTVKRVIHELRNWSCSRDDVYWLHPSVDAPVYRVQWADSEEEYKQGRRQSAVVPRNLDTFWNRTVGRKKGPKIGLGNVSCMGTLIPRGDKPMYVGIATIASDGSYSVPSSPTRIGPEQVTKTIDRNARD